MLPEIKLNKFNAYQNRYGVYTILFYHRKAYTIVECRPKTTITTRSIVNMHVLIKIVGAFIIYLLKILEIY